MNKHYFFAEFIFLSIFFLMPPLFRSAVTYTALSSPQWHFSYMIFPCFVIALILYVQYNRIMSDKKLKCNFLSLIILSGYLLITFGELCVTSAIVETVSIFQNRTSSRTVVLPHTNFQLLLYLLSFLLSAFYEEILYRMYLPFALAAIEERLSSLKKITSPVANYGGWSFRKVLQTGFIPLIHLKRLDTKLSARIKKTASFLFTEAVPVLVFAFSHRYLGMPAVLNALIAGIFLRICFLKSGSIFSGFAAHFLYNIFMLVLQFCLQKPFP